MVILWLASNLKGEGLYFKLRGTPVSWVLIQANTWPKQSDGLAHFTRTESMGLIWTTWQITGFLQGSLGPFLGGEARSR